MSRPPVHPSTILREDVLPSIGMTKTDVAKSLGISRQHLHNIINCKARITPKVAIALERVCGSSAKMWLKLQYEHEIYLLTNNN